MFGSYFTKNKGVDLNGNGGIFGCRRASIQKNDIVKVEPFLDQKRGVSRKASPEMRSSLSNLSINNTNQPQIQQTNSAMQQITDKRQDILRTSFFNQKHSCSAKLLTESSQIQKSVQSNHNSIFFLKPTNNPNDIAQKQNEGNINHKSWPIFDLKARMLQKVSQSTAESLKLMNYGSHLMSAPSSKVLPNKYKSMLEQSNVLRSSLTKHQLFTSETERPSQDKNGIFQEKKTKEEDDIFEKENEKFFFSTYQNDKKVSLDIKSHQNTFEQERDCNTQQLGRSLGQKEKVPVIPIDNSIKVLYKQNNLKNCLKVDQEGINKGISFSEDTTSKKQTSQQKLNEFFNSKKALSPMSNHQKPSSIFSRLKNPMISPETKQILKQTTSQKLKTALYQNTQIESVTQNNNTNSHQNSFQGNFKHLTQSIQMDDKIQPYFSKEGENQVEVPNANKIISSSPQITNLAGSIINLKKSKKKTDIQQIISKPSASIDVSIPFKQKQYHIKTHIYYIQIKSEVMMLRMEVYNLKNVNAVLSTKNETLEKEKRHYKNMHEKKQQECDQLNELINQMKGQVEQHKMQIKMSNFSSQETTLAHRSQGQGYLQNHTISAQETPRNPAQNSHYISASPNLYGSGNCLQYNSNNIMVFPNNHVTSQGQIMNPNHQILQQRQHHLASQTQYNQIQFQLNSNNQQELSKQNEQFPVQNEFLIKNQHDSNIQQTPLQNQKYKYQRLSISNEHNEGVQKERVQNLGLSPIINSDERSDFISNSILEDIPTNQSQIRTLDESLIASQQINEFDMIQNQQIPLRPFNTHYQQKLLQF